MCTDYDLLFLAQATTAELFPCRDTFEIWSWECDQLQPFFVEWHYTEIKIETLLSGFSENNSVFSFFLGTHIAKAFLYIHLLEIPHFSLQQGSLHHKIHVDCLRRQPLVERKKQEKPPTKSYRKLVKKRRVVCRLTPAEQINLKHIPINPQWTTKTKITLKQVKFFGIYSLLWLLFGKGLTIAAS